ncbi:Z1 domain-containing protein [Selenomonas noxia]|jgi:endonuclease|uniref:Z1 domain-containing protein n=2 Tax=Selenomonas noxia TaxID=135083 RepID=UPI0028807C21|nr:Z1 domain-containing protein [Selenomonas noxia]
MSRENAELFERNISICINSIYQEKPPTEEEFMAAAAEFRTRMGSFLPPVDDQEFQEILARLRSQIVVEMDVGEFINDRTNGHQSWLPARRAEIDFFFWERYKKYLEEEKKWNPRVTANLGKISDEILDLCGDPEEPYFSVRGLVLGDVQSGKTANYTAICNKAADVGYRIIIVLAGMQENLRKQTQERLDAEFAGHRSEYFLDPTAKKTIKNKAVGVGRHGDRSIKKRVSSFTSVTKDFDSGVLRSCNLSIESVNGPVLLVVKKNKRILDNLISWLDANNTVNAGGKVDLPLLLIDDEADNASVNTRDSDDDPTAINNCIRQLLGLFSKTTYLGITATPFANIFIDPRVYEDLFPSDFIYALSAPSHYIGADRMFGDDDERSCSHMIERIDREELELCLPPKHKSGFVVSKLPADLYEACNYFLLVNAVRDMRGDRGEHRSMMVHLSRFRSVQAQIADLLTMWLSQVNSDLRNYAKRHVDKAGEIASIHELHRVWDKYKLSDAAGISWAKMLKSYLYKAVAPINVREVNMNTGAASLDYFNHKKDGLRVIAVGGNSLSRGLTLEGLCVTYFHRNTRMYDTLLQMGRWFGYRPNYDDLVKVWLTEEMIDWYGQITRASAELKEEIAEMRNAHQTPRDFGLRVRQDPGALIVTARNKMRTAEEITCPVTVSGQMLETPRLKASPKILKDNELVFKAFIRDLAKHGERVVGEERAQGHLFWQHVPGSVIAQLLHNFETNPWHLSYNGPALSDFVAANVWKDGWDVVLFNRGEGKAYPEGLECGSEIISLNCTEKRKILADQRMLSVTGTKVRVGQGGWTRVGLSKAQIASVEERFRKENKKKHVPDRAYLIEDRPPILMLHVLQAEYEGTPSPDLPEFLFALGVGFPRAEYETTTAKYKVNRVELRNWADIPDESDEEEQD